MKVVWNYVYTSHIIWVVYYPETKLKWTQTRQSTLVRLTLLLKVRNKFEFRKFAKIRIYEISKIRTGWPNQGHDPFLIIVSDSADNSTDKLDWRRQLRQWTGASFNFLNYFSHSSGWNWENFEGRHEKS